MRRVIAIGDIHGQAGAFVNLIDKLAPSKDDELIFLGDLIDYGDSISEVITITQYLRMVSDVTILFSNHELLFLDYVTGGKQFTPANVSYLEKGGAATLQALGLSGDSAGCGLEAVPSAMTHLLSNCVLSYRRGNCIFVHGGFSMRGWRSNDVEEALANSSATDLVWDRSALERKHDLGVLVVHGHTGRVDGNIADNRPYTLGLETGAAFGGRIAAAIFDPSCEQVLELVYSTNDNAVKLDGVRVE